MDNLIFKGYLVRADFEEKTMTFEIINDMVVKAGNYTIVRAEDYEKLVKNIDNIRDSSALLEELLNEKKVIIGKGRRSTIITTESVKNVFEKHGIK